MLTKFLEESNEIEGIFLPRGMFNEQLEHLNAFINYQDISVKDILELAQTFQKTSRLPPAELRSRKGMDVIVGGFRPIKGGPAVKNALEIFLTKINGYSDCIQNVMPLVRYIEYETIHPLIDCNGRTGRAIWAWLWNKRGYDFSLGFLKKYHYETFSVFENR